MFTDKNKVFFIQDGKKQEILIKDIMSVDKEDVFKIDNGIKIEFSIIINTFKNGIFKRTWLTENISNNQVISLSKERCARELKYNHIIKKMKKFDNYNIVHCCDKSCLNNQKGYCNKQHVEFINDLTIDEEYSELIEIPNFKCLDYKKKELY